MSVLVRSWNVFHGNTKPPQRRAFLERMVRLAVADRPHVVCLQEVPAWAVPLLDDWSGMVAFGDVASRPMLGPLPSTAEIGRRITELNHGLFRSAFTGQANALLVDPALVPRDHAVLTLNPRRFRRKQADWLGLDLLARLAWARERRVCQAVRVTLPDGKTAFVANLHATSYPPDERLADAELLRAAVFLDALAEPGEACVLAGDLNVKLARSRTLSDLTGPEWRFAGGGPGIDHVFARDIPIGPVERWPDDRRREDGCLLSDHAPVEARIG